MPWSPAGAGRWTSLIRLLLCWCPPAEPARGDSQLQGPHVLRGQRCTAAVTAAGTVLYCLPVAWCLRTPLLPLPPSCVSPCLFASLPCSPAGCASACVLTCLSMFPCLHMQVCLEYLQRYFTLVCFASYVKGAHFPPSSPSSLTFGEWLAGRPELRSILERLLRYNPAAALALNKSPDALAPSEPVCLPACRFG